MTLALALGELSAALPLSSLAFSLCCAINCSTGKESCNTTTKSAISNPRPNDRSMRRFIYESKDFDQRPRRALRRSLEKGQIIPRSRRLLGNRNRKLLIPFIRLDNELPISLAVASCARVKQN